MFEIGLRAANEAAIQPDNMPEGGYEAVVSPVKDQLALDSVHENTTKGSWTHLGRCTIRRTTIVASESMRKSQRVTGLSSAGFYQLASGGE